MGGALVKGWCAALPDEEIITTARSEKTLNRIKETCPRVVTSLSNGEAARVADVIVLCVKPWLIDDVIDEIQGETGGDIKGKTIISVAANKRNAAIDVYAMPNLAAERGRSMTFIESGGKGEKAATAERLFSAVGRVMTVGRGQMTAGMMVSGCGIAYAMRFLRAMSQGAVELGLPPQAACEAALQTIAGAMELLSSTGMHPEQAIDRVTTAGGVTIKGLNAMEHAGFTSAVIKGLKAEG